MSVTTRETIQETFIPVDYHFEWADTETATGWDRWYEWDSKEGHKTARKLRDQRARELRKEGWEVRCHSQRSLISRGGIGSGNPHVTFEVTTYSFDAYRDKD